MRDEILGVIETLDELMESAVYNGKNRVGDHLDEAILNLYDAIREL